MLHAISQINALGVLFFSITFFYFCRFSALYLILTRRLFSLVLVSSGSSGTFSLKLHIFPAWAVHLTEKKVSDCVGSLQFPFLLFSLHHCISDVTETLTSHSKGVIMPWPHQKKWGMTQRFLSPSSLSLSLSHLSFTFLAVLSIIFFTLTVVSTSAATLSSLTHVPLPVFIHLSQNELMSSFSVKPKLCPGLRWLCISHESFLGSGSFSFAWFVLEKWGL